VQIGAALKQRKVADDIAHSQTLIRAVHQVRARSPRRPE
jgi:hypothetical protein